MHGKNIMSWDANDIAEAKKVLERFKLKVSEMASPVFKTDWPNAPKSPYSPKKPEFGADFTYQQQDELLDKAIDLAKTFNTQYSPRLRLLASRRSEAASPGDRRADPRGRGQNGEEGDHADARERARVQHGDWRRSRPIAERGARKRADAELGSGQRGGARREGVPGRLCEGAEGSDRARPLQGRGQEGERRRHRNGR